MGNMASNTVNQMAFCPPPPTYRKKDVNMWLETDRGNRIPAFHIRSGHPLTVLVSHANAEDLGIVLAFWSWISEALQARARARALRTAPRVALLRPPLPPWAVPLPADARAADDAPAPQVDVLAYEYSGYGHSTGSPSEDNIYSDARAALALLVDGFKLKPERDIVLYGKSLGSCPACYLASKNKARAAAGRAFAPSSSPTPAPPRPPMPRWRHPTPPRTPSAPCSWSMAMCLFV